MKGSSYIGLARKYRPQRFEDMVGQEAVSRTLQNAIRANHLACAYLFFGPRGIGKTTAARILAKALNCHKGLTPTPCGECLSCQEISSGNSIDVLEMDAASHTSVENVRQVIIETVSLAASRDRFRVFIMDEAHMLSNSAFNALLKTIEEPPGHVKFILATTEPGKIPATIFSRCQRFRFRPISEEEMRSALKKWMDLEGIQAEEGALHSLIRAAAGSLRDGISLLEQAHAYAGKTAQLTQALVAELLGILPQEVVLGMGKAVLKKDVHGLWRCLQEIYKEGFDPAQLLRDLRDAWEWVYLDRMGMAVFEFAAAPQWRELSVSHSAETFSFLLKRLNHMLEDIRNTDSPRLVLEMGFFGMLESAYDLNALVERLEGLELRLSGKEEPNPAKGGPPEARLAGGGLPAASQVRQEPPARSSVPPAPSSPHSAATSPEQIWKVLLDQLHVEKPVLSAQLRAAVLSPGEAGLAWPVGRPWNVAFQRDFEREGAERSRSLIESRLSSLAGYPVQVQFELAKSVPKPRSGSPPHPKRPGLPVREAGLPSPLTDGMEESTDSKALLKGASQWQDIGATDVSEDPGVRKALKYFPGTVRPIQ